MQQPEQESNYEKAARYARELFLQHDCEALARKFALKIDDLYLYIRYFDSDCRISRSSGQVDVLCAGKFRECREYNTVMSIYDVLCHSAGSFAPKLTGTWCSTRSLTAVGANPDTLIFNQRYADAFDANFDALQPACEQLGGQILPSMARADLTCKFDAFEFFPIVMQFWQSDEEFVAKLMVLWDTNALEFMHFETTYYVMLDLYDKLLSLVAPAS